MKRVKTVDVSFSELQGKTLKSVEASSDEIRFETDDGVIYLMLHEQDCCENVSVEDVTGDWDDVIGSEILLAEERSQTDENAEYESGTWTFYEIASLKGRVQIRWYGSSNGYYSEDVSFKKVL